MLPGAKLLDADGVFGVSSSIPLTFFSGVATTHIEGDVDRRVMQIADWFRVDRRPFRWWVTPASTPPDLAERLRVAGLEHAYDCVGMTADLAQLPSLRADVRIERVASDSEMAAWAHVLMTVFGRPASDGVLWRDGFGAIGFGDDSPWAHFVAFANDTPVATTSVLFAGDLAGIYHVGTLAEARRKGIGAAITVAGLQHAYERGARVAALQSSPSGMGVYQSLGFVPCGTLTLYHWRGL